MNLRDYLRFHLNLKLFRKAEKAEKIAASDHILTYSHECDCGRPLDEDTMECDCGLDYGA